MKRLLVTPSTQSLEREDMQALLRSTRDGDLFDFDILRHESTFILKAFTRGAARAYLPVQQPLMMENFVFRSGLTEAETGQAMVRLAEHVVEEAYQRDAGEVYFLCRDKSTCKFAERYGFKDVSLLGLKTYRMNLLETFGC